MTAADRRVILPLACAFAIACVLASVAPARAATWVEGTPTHPFRLADTGGLIVTDSADPSIIAPYVASTFYNGVPIEFEPRSISMLPDGSLLVTCGKHGTIVRISKDGRLLKQYTAADIAGLERPFDAVPTSDGGMLIVDRSLVQGEGRVFRVDSSLKEVWQFGGKSGLGAGLVFDPFTAVQVAGSHTLIADSLGHRIVEIDDAGDIVWSFGEFKVPGSDGSHLNRPHSAQRLSNGNTLICDSENHRVIEVSHSGTVVWRFGSGVGGTGKDQLSNPNFATRLPNGNTLIADSDNARVLEVNHAGGIVQEYGADGRTPDGGTLNDPRAALRLPSGVTVIADLANMRLAGYGYQTRHEWTATSSEIDPSAGARKRFTALRVNASVPHGAFLSVEYSINAGPWTTLSGTHLPPDAIGTNIRYRIRLTTSSGAAAPVVRSVTIEWVIAGASGSSAGGSGSSGTHTSTTSAGTNSGSGSGSTTSAAPGGTTALPQGAEGGPHGTGGQAVGMSSAVSGWVMSEVQDKVLDLGSAGVTGPGSGSRPSSDSTVPGIAILLAVYGLGFSWTPVTRFATVVLARIVTATMSR